MTSFVIFTVDTYTVGCRGVVQLGGTDSWCIHGGPDKVGAYKSFLFTEISHVVKIKNTWLILLSHFIQIDLILSITKQL